MPKIQRWLVIVFVLITLGGCSRYVEGTEIPITQVAEYNELVGSNPDHYQDKSILLLIISQPEEKTKLETLMPAHLKSTIHGLSLNQSIAIAVFQGEKYSSGYGVQIMKILYRGSDMYVYTQFETPQRGQLQEGGTRSPVSVVTIERSAFAASERLTVHLMNDATKQELLAQEYSLK